MYSHETDHGETVRQNPPLLPVQHGNVRIPNIVFINAVLYVMENGCKWRALPERFGKWYTLYARFRRWYQSGVLERLFAALWEQQAVDDGTECFGLDNTGRERRAGRKASASRAAGGTRRSTSSRQVTVWQWFSACPAAGPRCARRPQDKVLFRNFR